MPIFWLNLFQRLIEGRCPSWSKEPDLRSGVLFTHGFEPHSSHIENIKKKTIPYSKKIKIKFK